MDIVAELQAAKVVIDTPEKWTKGSIARDAHSIGVKVRDEAAVCFCLLGALDRAGAGFRSLEAVVNALPSKHHSIIADFNDDETTTHAMVLEVLDKAIAAASATTGVA